MLYNKEWKTTGYELPVCKFSRQTIHLSTSISHCGIHKFGKLFTLYRT